MIDLGDAVAQCTKVLDEINDLIPPVSSRPPAPAPVATVLGQARYCLDTLVVLEAVLEGNHGILPLVVGTCRAVMDAVANSVAVGDAAPGGAAGKGEGAGDGASAGAQGDDDDAYEIEETLLFKAGEALYIGWKEAGASGCREAAVEAFRSFMKIRPEGSAGEATGEAADAGAAEMLALGILSSVHLLARTYLAELLIEDGDSVESAPLDEADALLSQHIRLMRADGPLGSAGWGVEEQRSLAARSVRERERRYWASRIRAGKTGWDQASPNAHLVKIFPTLPTGPRRHVLVPLCGMSVDMLWLVSQGCVVTGAEFCRDACERFFARASIPFTAETVATAAGHPAVLFRSGSEISIWCCDFTFLSGPDLARDGRPPVDLVWDRASIVAIPIPTRQTYVDTITALAQPGATVITAVWVYSKEEREKSPDGYTSPYLVSKEELRQLYGGRDIETISIKEDALEPRHASWGISFLREEVYKLTL